MAFTKRALIGINKLIEELKQMIINGVTPSKTVSWFYRNTPPTGWIICNGKWYSTDGKQNSNTETDVCVVPTPNLIGRYPLGASSGIGSTVEAGLPNITGEIGNWDVQVGAYGSGVFYNKQYGNYNDHGGTYKSNYVKSFGFDASRSNSIYGKSNTVTPPSVKLLPCMKL